jgi:pyridoxamine 5'-phosphate oxidase
MANPIDIFKAAWQDAKSAGSLAHRNSACISTIDASGFPNSRFVDLKEVEETGFVFCTCMDSEKAMDLERNPKASMAIWWEHITMQIRIKGRCVPISEQESDAHWSNRSRDAQISTAAFRQSQPVADLDFLAQKHSRTAAEYAGRAIPRPANWGGFRLCPEHIEFLEFSESRLHLRTTYTLSSGQWHIGFLQP